MIKNKHIILFLVLILAHSLPVFSQQAIGDYSKQEVKELGQKVEDQVQFLEFFFNTVGSKDTPARDKDVIIRESYKKIFRDDKVQVEDDLLLDRKVITNKDITAYLKDIEFFFKDANFKFRVREVKPFLRDNDELSFIVILDRTIVATGLNQETISNTKERFIEVNVDKKSNELKIASIYTTKLSRDQELQEWWSSLPDTWASYFKSNIGLDDCDSVDIEQLYKISSLDSINLSGNQYVMDLVPIEALRELKYLDISYTQIQELNPISNITFLTHLNISNTITKDIQFIKYSDKLTYLDISNTLIIDISELENLKSLTTLKAVETPIISFDVLNSFESLRFLNLKGNGFNNLSNIEELNQLVELDLSSNYLINFEFLAQLEGLESINLQETNIVDMTPLKDLPNLKVVNINQTEVSDLNPLDKIPTLNKIYADRTRIQEWEADEFTRRNKSVLLIHHIENLQTWWNGLTQPWKDVFVKINPVLDQTEPSIEAISSLIGLDSLDLSGSSVLNLGPVLKFKKIVSLYFDNTGITDLSPLADIKTLVKITGRNSKIISLQPLASLANLESVDLRNSPVFSISPLIELTNLKYLNVDHAMIATEEVVNAVFANQNLNVIFRSVELEGWWSSLDETWKGIFMSEFGTLDEPNIEQLHVLTTFTKLNIESRPISHFKHLEVFINLRDLSIYDVPVTDFSDLHHLDLIENLKISKSPFSDLEVISKLRKLTRLDLSDTGIDDLRPLSVHPQLKSLNTSGTNIKSIRGLDSLYDLEELDIANTNVRSLNPIQGLVNMKKLSCFNTKISKKGIDNFKKLNPECDVRFY